jgi:tetratricopeptide (TPR) repeat protein
MFPKIKYSTPLGVICLFVIISEIFLSISVNKTSGIIQLILVIFVITFPILVALGFFLVLVYKPYVFYPPSEYPKATNPKEFIGALRGDNSSSEKLETKPIPEESTDPILPSSEKSDEGKTIAIPKKDDWVSAWMDKKYESAREILLRLHKTSRNKEERINYQNNATWVLHYYEEPAAISEYLKIISKNPSILLYQLSFINLLIRKNDYDAAISKLDEFSKNETIKIQLLFKKAEVLFLKKDFEEAEKVILSIQKENISKEEKAKTFRLIGSIYKEKKIIPVARDQYIKAYKEAPISLENLDEIGTFFNEIKDIQYELFFRRKMFEVEETERSIVLYGNSLLANSFNNLAMTMYLKADNLVKGKAAWIKSNIGNLYNNLGLYTLAEKNLQESLKIESESDYAHERLAWVLKNLKDEKENIENKINEVTL